MIVFDCEVWPPDIPNTKPTRMTICSWWNSETHTIKTVEADEIEVFIAEANDDPVLVGYNVLNFDFHLFDSVGRPADAAIEKTFDLYRALWYIVTGGNTKETPEGLTLEAMAQVNLGKGKWKLMGTAASLWACGAYDVVIGYNKNDVALCRDLMMMALEYDYLEYERGPDQYEIIDCSDFNERIYAIENKGIYEW